MIISGSNLQSKQNTYLTAEQVAELLGCSKQWARELADAYGAISVKSSFGGGSSGTSYRFPLHNLPPEAQRKYMEMQTKRVKTAYETAPQWIRDQAEQRLWLLEEWEYYCSRHSKLKKPDIFKLLAAPISAAAGRRLNSAWHRCTAGKRRIVKKAWTGFWARRQRNRSARSILRPGRGSASYTFARSGCLSATATTS